MIRRPTKDTAPDDYVGKFILCDSIFEWGLVGELRYVSKASGARLYVIRPQRDGTVEAPDRPEGHILSRRVKVICDTWAEAQRCIALNVEGQAAHEAIMKQWDDARKALHGKLRAMCDEPAAALLGIQLPAASDAKEEAHG